MRISFLHLATLWRRAGVVLFVLLLAAAHAQITPSADSYTNTAHATTNYGAAGTLGVVNSTTSIQTTYIQFSLSSIPAGYTGTNVAMASLKLFVNSVTTAGSFNVDYVNGTWSESTISANLAPALGATIVGSVPLTTANVNNYILINVTSAVQAWLNGTEPNDGIALVANSPLNASFDSKENTAQSHPAELDIVFTSGGTITGVETASGSGLAGGGTSGTLNLSLLTGCSPNQVLEWTGSAWACSSPGGVGGAITAVTAGTGLTGGGTSGTVTLNVNESVVAFQSDLTSGISTAEGFASTAATTAQNTAEAYANSTFLPLAGGTMTGTLNLPANGLVAGTNQLVLSGGNIGIGTAMPQANLDVLGKASFTGSLTSNGPATLTPTNTATAAAGYNSNSLSLTGSSFNSSTSSAVPQQFLWQTEPSGNNTANPSGTLNLLFGSGGTTPIETGLSIANNGIITFASGQVFPSGGGGTITGVTAGTDLLGGGTNGNVTLNIDTTKVVTGVTAGTGLTGGGTGGSVTLNLNLAAANTWTGKITTATPASGAAGFNLPHGSAPSSPNNGDCWTTTSGLYCQINGNTVGPYGTGSGGGTSGTFGQSSTTNSNIGSTSLVSSVPSTPGMYAFDWVISLTGAGSGCSGSTTVTLNLIFTDPNASSSTTEALGTITLAPGGNGTVGFVAQGREAVLAKNGTSISYSSSGYSAGSGCSTNPSYQVSYVYTQIH